MIRWITPILLAQTAYAAEQTAQVQGVLGGSIRLSPVLPDGFRTRDVFWKHLSRSDELVASFSRGFSETTYRSRFFGRVQLGSDFTLQIGGLELGDSGTFSCHLVDTEGHMALFQFHLTVYEAVAPPLIQVFVLRGRADATGCSVLLSCNTTAGSDVSYTWTANSGRGDPLNTTYTLYDAGHLLRTSLEPGDSDASYTCTASNAVSQGHEAVVPWHGCSAGKTVENFNHKIAVYTAASILITFTVLTACILLSVNCAGEPHRKARRGIEEGELEDNEEAALQENQEATTRHNEGAEPQAAGAEPQAAGATTQNVESETETAEATTQNAGAEPQNQELTQQNIHKTQNKTAAAPEP